MRLNVSLADVSRSLRTLSNPPILLPLPSSLMTSEFYWPWLVCDYLGDVINLVDLLCMKPRLSFVSVQDGTWVTSPGDTARHYLGTGMCWVRWKFFKLD